jgi:hypothetical protein
MRVAMGILGSRRQGDSSSRERVAGGLDIPLDILEDGLRIDDEAFAA